MTTYCVTCSTRIIPLPIVLATAVPSRKAATKLKNAAHATASLGDRTRVDTTVAMLLAASWNPLRKSKISAVTTVMISSSRFTSVPVDSRVGCSGVLQYDGFQHIGHVFGLVRGAFEEFKQFLGLDQGDGVLFVVEQLGDRLLSDGVGFILQPV